MAETKKTTKKAATKKTTTKKAPAKKTTTKKTTVKKSTPQKKTTPVIIQDKNEYGSMFVALLLIVVVLVACYVGYQYKSGNLVFGEYKQTEDEKKFEKEYEELNGTANNAGVTNKNVDVIEDNKVKYITLAEAEKMLESGTGVIYFGFASCPWCRNLLPTLLTSVKENKLETLYYVNLLDEEGNDLRSIYKLNEKGRAKKEKEAAPEYYNILSALSEHLSDYVLYTESGKEVKTPEKRLSAPTVVAVKNGEIIDVVESTVEMTEKEQGALKVISKQDKTEVSTKYNELIKKYLEETKPEEE